MDNTNLLASAKEQLLARLEEFLKHDPKVTAYSSSVIYRRIDKITLEHDGVEVDIQFATPRDKVTS